MIHTKIVYICFTQVDVYGIAYFPFHSVPYSVPFFVPRFSNTYGFAQMCLLIETVSWMSNAAHGSLN